MIIRLISNFKHNQSSPSTTTRKICQTFVISSNQYGSFRPIQTISRSDSLFSNIDFAIPNEKINIHLTINHLYDTSEYQQSKASLLEHYLTTYNPLHLHLTNADQEIQVISETDARTEGEDKCYCTNKQICCRNGRYVRLKEQEKCSATMSIQDDRLSECSTKSTGITVPMVMVTDCSNIERLHTDIIEMDEEEEEEEKMKS